MLFFYELDQLALAQHYIAEVQPREFDLFRQRSCQQAAFGETLEQPVVKRALILELKRADRVGHAFQRVFDRMRVGIHRIDAPGVAGAVMLGAPDAIDRRIAQIDVGRGHVDFCAQHQRAVGVFALAHLMKEAQRFLGRALAPRTVFARFFQRAAIGAHFVGALLVNISVAGIDEVFSGLVHEAEIIAGEIQVLVAEVLPVETEPMYCGEDGVDVFLLFFLRIGIVETHVAGAAEIAREAEIEADRFGVAEMQIAVGLRRKTGADFRRVGGRSGVRGGAARFAAPAALRIGAAGEIRFNDVANEVGDVRCGGFVGGL